MLLPKTCGKTDPSAWDRGPDMGSGLPHLFILYFTHSCDPPLWNLAHSGVPEIRISSKAALAKTVLWSPG